MQAGPGAPDLSAVSESLDPNEIFRCELLECSFDGGDVARRTVADPPFGNTSHRVGSRRPFRQVVENSGRDGALPGCCICQLNAPMLIGLAVRNDRANTAVQA